MNNGKQIAIIGAGGHAKVVYDICTRGNYQVVAFFDNVSPDRKEYLGVKVANCWQSLREICSNDSVNLIIAIGDNFLRKKLFHIIEDEVPNAHFATVIDPSAVISNHDTLICEGTVVMPGAIINAGTIVGSHCIVNTGAQLDHDCKMENFSSLGPGAVCGGNVIVGEGSAICLGAKVIEKITIGSWSIIGAGSVVVANIKANKLAYGLPAKERSGISPGKKYLK
ncbi:acetyltransferase [Desulfurispirillum indicum]|uniref:acetyltransferase n=1 Tax=Desulfurispirillum indicum TaxID=936456 RepID=UPI001CFC023B|nr:acetyltransferase [Desulfurispirillum indicum]UCZ56533.1 acetyltransferase [Desulfurispirillum indicum]